MEGQSIQVPGRLVEGFLVSRPGRSVVMDGSARRFTSPGES
jgi:hypothetical protein